MIITTVYIWFIGGFNFANAQYLNPLGDVKSFPELLGRLAKNIIVLVLPLAVLALVWNGMQYIINSGNPSKLTEVRKTFFWILMGTAIAIGASAITAAVVNFLKNPG